MAGIRVIAKATDEIAKFREAKKMVRASCDASESARASQAFTSHPDAEAGF